MWPESWCMRGRRPPALDLAQRHRARHRSTTPRSSIPRVMGDPTGDRVLPVRRRRRGAISFFRLRGGRTDRRLRGGGWSAWPASPNRPAVELSCPLAVSRRKERAVRNAAVAEGLLPALEPELPYRLVRAAPATAAQMSSRAEGGAASREKLVDLSLVGEIRSSAVAPSPSSAASDSARSRLQWGNHDDAGALRRERAGARRADARPTRGSRRGEGSPLPVSPVSISASRRGASARPAREIARMPKLPIAGCKHRRAEPCQSCAWTYPKSWGRSTMSLPSARRSR